MPHLILSREARAGLQRCHSYLKIRNIEASRRAGDAIRRAFQNLRKTPEIGRPFDRDLNQRELIVPFGDSGYTVLYRFDAASDAIVILAFRHQKEAGY